MSETKIEIIVSGDRAAETLAEITAQLPEGATVSDGSAAAETVPTLDHLLEDAVVNSAALPQQFDAWLQAMPVSPFTVMIICAALFAAAYVV